RYAKGTHVRTLLQISADEEITAVVSLADFTPDDHLFMATAKGVVKKVTTDQFSNARTRGINAIRLDEGDRLCTALLTSGNDELFLVTRKGKGLRFHEESVRAMGRTSRGVTGIRLRQNDELAGCVVVNEEEQMLTVTEYGYGKRTRFDEFTPHGRGTGGQVAYGTNERSGELVGVVSVSDESELMIITSQGQTIKLSASMISMQSRSATGVRVVDISKPDYVVGLDRTADSDEDEDERELNAGVVRETDDVGEADRDGSQET
ncbi:MAG: DNA gyrase C-terminal beta-propeller domain-containing protein, partial [Spirochaetota bacterium]